ncbi:SDR family NAD(P)-dependent oxidoreductase [Bradyrhizobium brasilense]|uniref:SDR family NAD(P)-dependent oxidoreductase n=1 Tax=Bradyrhizobium brasilense TaxID=1419277 RepID=UPI001F3AFBD0|nr:SDR family oxidoreductase [Bradyrhizobium brasilense]
MNDLDFAHKTVLVVGGSSGIGNAIAQGFRSRGAEVHVWGTRTAATDYAADEGCDLTGLHYSRVDVSDFDAIEALQPTFSTLDVLVLSQGIVLYGRREFEMRGFRQIIDVNLNSLMACSLKFHEMLQASRGSIIVLSSMAGFRSTKGNPAYNASKAGAVGLTRTLGEAWAEDGIRVNGIAPGLVATKLTKVTTDHPKRREATEQRVPLKRLGQPEDMVGTALYLASPLSSYMVGQTLIVDGGITLA